MKKVIFKDGTYVVSLKEWFWSEQPNLKIFKDQSCDERLYETFVDIELNGQLKTQKYHFGPLHIDSNFHSVLMTVRKKDIKYV